MSPGAAGVRAARGGGGAGCCGGGGGGRRGRRSATGGGGGAFVRGVAMASAGAYLVTSRVVVTTGGWRLWGVSGFGMSLIPFMAGVALLFFNGRNPLGWLLSV